jgi:hypothetical protein
MLTTDLPRCQRFRKAVLIELRVGARSRDGSHIDNEIDSGFLQQIGKFDDRPGRNRLVASPLVSSPLVLAPPPVLALPLVLAPPLAALVSENGWRAANR